MNLEQPDSTKPGAHHNLSKIFGGVLALENVDLTIGRGEVHAILGENGSGKSTFIKVLLVYHRPDGDGTVLIERQELSVGSPASAYQLGCRFVHQDLGLISASSIVDNLYLNAGFPTTSGTIRERAARSRAVADLAKVGLDVDPRTPVSVLSSTPTTDLNRRELINLVVGDEFGEIKNVARELNIELGEPVLMVYGLVAGTLELVSLRAQAT